jgi:hypothetical protein
MPTPTSLRSTVARPASFGSPLKEILARDLTLSDDLLIHYGKLYVDATQIGKETGKKYRKVAIAFKDKQGEHCLAEHIYYEGQCQHVEELFAPFHERTVMFGMAGINTEQVEKTLHKSGKYSIYTYKVRDLFLLSLNAIRSDYIPPEPELAPAAQPAPVPATPVAATQPVASPEPQEAWDADLPDEMLPDEKPPVAPKKLRAIMTATQLAEEQQRYWSDLANALPNQQERSIFLACHSLPTDFQRWQETDLPKVAEQLQRWFDVISPEHPLGHDNWDQPLRQDQKEAIFGLLPRWPRENDGKRLILEYLRELGHDRVVQLSQGEAEALRLKVLADPRCPSPKES